MLLIFAQFDFYFLDQSDLDLTDGILRKADLPIVDTILCQQFLDVNARSDDMHAGFICAGGQGKEESCYVSSKYLPIKLGSTKLLQKTYVRVD